MNAKTQIAKTLLAALTLNLIVALNTNAAEKDSFQPTTYGGTLIQVNNATNRTLEFDLFVETTSGRTGKFDYRLSVQPGQTAIWKLSAGHQVATTVENGKKMYRVGVVGIDQSTGKGYKWGLVGGKGMLGREGQTVEALTSGGNHFNTLTVQPMGSL